MDGKKGIGYISEIHTTKSTQERAIFEVFYYDVYRIIERRINLAINEGIDNIFKVTDINVSTKGRISYSHATFDNIELAKILIERE